MTFESFEVLIEFAIEKEKEAAAFYTDLAGRTSFSGVKIRCSRWHKKKKNMNAF